MMLVTILSGTVARSCLLAVACGLAALVFRGRSAEIRHFIWCGALYGLLILPLLQFAVVPSAGALPYGEALTALYLTVAFVLLIRLMLGLLYVTRIVSRSEAIFGANLRELAHDAWLQSLSSYRPGIRLSREVCVPMTAGVHESCILLPSSCTSWPREKLQAVLLHEFAHVRRGDPAIAFLSSLLVCVFWIHPLSYWLRRQLAVLAEEACDEVALERMQPADYARILVEIVGSLPVSGGRILPVCSIVIRRSQANRRIERIFSARPRGRMRYRWTRVSLMVAFFPVLYLAGAIRFGHAQNANAPNNGKLIVADTEQARAAEADLQRDPENLQERGALMAFYANEQDELDFTQQLLWMIDHHPESPTAAMRVYPRPGNTNSSEDRALIQAAWERAIATHPESPEVLFHAGVFIEQGDPARALKLLRQAQGLASTDPERQERYSDAIAQLYEAAVFTDLHANDKSFRASTTFPSSMASALHAELETSNDPVLLSKVGTKLVQTNQDAVGLGYLQRAIDFDPANPAWKEALESAKAEPVRRQNRREMIGGEMTGPVRIGAGVANANLLTKVEPQYPEAARQARVQGSVEFTVDIGRDGRISSIQLVRGDPLLVNAAKDAVLQSVYRPTLLNGKPIEVTTTVVVPFRLE